jgi:hypothetical protein
MHFAVRAGVVDWLGTFGFGEEKNGRSIISR